MKFLLKNFNFIVSIFFTILFSEHVVQLILIKLIILIEISFLLIFFL